MSTSEVKDTLMNLLPYLLKNLFQLKHTVTKLNVMDVITDLGPSHQKCLFHMAPLHPEIFPL